MLEVRDGLGREHSVDPETLGLKRAVARAAKAATPTPTWRWPAAVLAGETGEHRDIVVLNAAAGLVVAGVVDDWATA